MELAISEKYFELIMDETCMIKIDQHLKHEI